MSGQGQRLFLLARLENLVQAELGIHQLSLVLARCLHHVTGLMASCHCIVPLHMLHLQPL